MAVRRGIVIGMLFALLASIGSALLLYKENQQQLTLEGNRLYSTQSIKVSGNLNDIRTQWQAAGDGFAAYKHVDDVGMVRSVYSPDYSSIHYPIHRGRTFTQDDTKAALVGAGVELVERHNESYFVFDGDEYEVVGYLGRHAESLLQYDVLLADPHLFAGNGSEPLVLDGPNVATHYSTFFNDGTIERMNQSTNRRTNIDFVSPILITLGFGVMALGSIFIGLLAASSVRERNRVGVLVGRTRRRMGMLSMVQLTIPAVAATVSVALIWNMLSGTTQSPLQAAINFLWQVPLAVVAMLAALAADARKA